MGVGGKIRLGARVERISLKIMRCDVFRDDMVHHKAYVEFEKARGKRERNIFHSCQIDKILRTNVAVHFAFNYHDFYVSNEIFVPTL